MEHVERKSNIWLRSGGLIWKDVWAKYITEREILKKRASMENLREKFEKTRDYALSVRNNERVDSYRQYAEKMIRFEEDTVRYHGGSLLTSLWIEKETNRKREIEANNKSK